jgi:hypothetical protein
MNDDVINIFNYDIKSNFSKQNYLYSKNNTSNNNDIISKNDYISNDESALIDSKESYEDYFDPNFPRWVAVCIFFVGIFGNLLSIRVFTHKKLRKNSTFIYLAFLCFVDLFVIIFGLGDLIIISYFKFVLRNKSLFICRVHTFLTYTFTHLSSFILASVSIERAIATNLINFAKCYCKPQTAYRIICLNTVIAVIFNFHNLIFLGYEDQTTEFFHNKTKIKIQVNCAPIESSMYEYFVDPYYQWIDLVLYAILPFIIMAFCSFFIIRVLVLSNKRMAKNLSQKGSNMILIKNQKSTIVGQSGGTDGEQTGESYSNNNEKKKSKTKLLFQRTSTQTSQAINSSNTNQRLNRTLHLTYTLISINTLFFCLVSPLAFVYIMVKGKESIENNKILINIVYLLAYSNHAFNFIFYGLSSPPYREVILDLLRINKNKNSSLMIINNNNTTKRNVNI